MAAVLVLAALVVAQGRAFEIAVDHEAGVESAVLDWDGRSVPMTREGTRWFALIGIDVDAVPGEREAGMTLRFDGGGSRRTTERIVIEHREFPTTRLEVEPRYVELSAEDQARAVRENDEIAAIYAELSPRRLWTEPFEAPLPGVTGGRNFGHRRVFNGQPRAPHSGADLRAATGTTVLAANRGRVVLAKDLFFSGNAVFLDHGLGVYSAYLHLSEILVEPGQLVERGQKIGLSGATGRVTGPHLHWGVRVLGARVDPFSLLGPPAR